MSREISYAQDPKGYMRWWRSKHRKDCADYAKNWRIHNPTICRELDRKHREKRTSKWRGNIVNNGLKSSIWKEAEQLAPDILRQEGFEDIFHFSRDCIHGHVDFLAKRNGIVYAFETTTSDMKRLNSSGRTLTRYLDIKYYVLFIKPDLSGFQLKQVPLSVTVVKLTMKEISNPTSIVH